VGYGKESEYDIFGQKKYTEIEMATMNSKFKATTQSGRKCNQCHGTGILEALEAGTENSYAFRCTCDYGQNLTSLGMTFFDASKRPYYSVIRY
jgi:hypothetical protein